MSKHAEDMTDAELAENLRSLQSTIKRARWCRPDRSHVGAIVARRQEFIRSCESRVKEIRLEIERRIEDC